MRSIDLRTRACCGATIRMRVVLPHEKMFPDGDGVASPECSLRLSVDFVHCLVDGVLRSGAVGEAEQHPINFRPLSPDPVPRRSRFQLARW